mgnify:CR=1 FL=1
MPCTKSIIFTKAAYSISIFQPFLSSKFFHPCFPFYFWSAYFLIKFPFYFWFISADPWRLLDPCRLPQPFFLTPAPEDFLQKFRTFIKAKPESSAFYIKYALFHRYWTPKSSFSCSYLWFGKYTEILQRWWRDGRKKDWIMIGIKPDHFPVFGRFMDTNFYLWTIF